MKMTIFLNNENLLKITDLTTCHKTLKSNVLVLYSNGLGFYSVDDDCFKKGQGDG